MSLCETDINRVVEKLERGKVYNNSILHTLVLRCICHGEFSLTIDKFADFYDKVTDVQNYIEGLRGFEALTNEK